jgi:hypothetical protein
MTTKSNWEGGEMKPSESRHAGFTTEELRQRRAQSMQNTRETSKNTIRLLEETSTTGSTALVELEKQGERINNSIKQTDTIINDMNQSERILRGMGSLFGAFTNKFRSDPQPINTPVVTATNQKNNSPTKVPDATSGSSWWPWGATASVQTTTQPVAATKKTGDAETDKFLEETDKDLDHMMNILTNIKAMSHAMNDELDRQAINITTLDANVDRAKAKMDNNTIRIRKI